jgi:hypothetical protein
LRLPDDISVEFGNDLAGGQFLYRKAHGAAS